MYAYTQLIHLPRMVNHSVLFTRKEVVVESEAEKWFREREEEKQRIAREAAKAEEEAKQKKKMKKVKMEIKRKWRR